jgi:hypothetical protein
MTINCGLEALPRPPGGGLVVCTTVHGGGHIGIGRPPCRPPSPSSDDLIARGDLGCGFDALTDARGVRSAEPWGICPITHVVGLELAEELDRLRRHIERRLLRAVSAAFPNTGNASSQHGETCRCGGTGRARTVELP